jgi:acetyl-CoA carboxylase, biotin carboxylase subunit
MGSKTSARALAIEVGAPVVPGTERGISNFEEARTIAAQIGYPVLLKASAGGGGKGMRAVFDEADLESSIRGASSEAERAFGSGEVYLEKLIQRPRHIEVQVLGDERGNLIHLGERECSIQRRHQKVVEECPSPLSCINPDLRRDIGEAALKIARAANYYNAGTLEFLADDSGKFYFLEMNTRLQVEHPVTELVTGVDIVRWQILIAAGEGLKIRQDEVRWSGCALECRVYAEDPENNFFPSPGKLTHYNEPGGPGVRVDSGVYPGWTVPIEYDPLLAKLVVWSETRELAIARMGRALSEFRILGIATNLEFFRQLMCDDTFVAGHLDNAFLESFMSRGKNPPKEASDLEKVAALLAATQVETQRTQSSPDGSAASMWQLEARRSLIR